MADATQLLILVVVAVVGTAFLASRYRGRDLAVTASGMALLLIALVWTTPPPEVRISLGALAGVLMNSAGSSKLRSRRTADAKTLAESRSQVEDLEAS